MSLETEWRLLKLSLERPYKDDKGEKFPILLDIEADGKFTYEPKVTLDENLKNNLHRIFQERGVDFFDNPDKRSVDLSASEQLTDADEENSGDENEDEVLAKHMTFEELNTMRSELLPQLHVALGEVSQARDILNSLVSSVQSNPMVSILSSLPQPDPALTATVVAKPPPIPSLQAFNAQIVIGSKDEALRKAAGLFDSAATRIEKSQRLGEQYWVNALKIRRGNWRLMPSPLPPGSFVGKGADRTSKDFLVSYGLEESPLIFRRRALANLSDVSGQKQIVFSNRPLTRMRISLRTSLANGGKVSTSTNTIHPYPENISVDEELALAQTEIIDQEIFSYLVKEASVLPTVLARVSERSIIIDAAEAIELQFDLLKDEDMQQTVVSPTCDIIYHGLHVLLLRKHGYQKSERLNSTAAFGTMPLSSYSPPILQPIIDFLQYNLFCERLEAELSKAAHGLNAAGISAAVSFNGVGEAGEELVQVLSEPRGLPISGEAILTIAERHTVRFTFIAPSNLTAHLSQATIHVYSMVQLSQLLTNEIERFLLQRICRLGQKLKGGTWLVDLDHLVARWEGCVLTFQLSFEKDLGINFFAFRLDSKTGRRGNLFQYSRVNRVNLSLFSWVEDIIMKVPS